MSSNLNEMVAQSMYSGIKFSITGSCHQFGGPVKGACGRFPMRAEEHKGGRSAGQP